MVERPEFDKIRPESRNLGVGACQGRYLRGHLEAIGGFIKKGYRGALCLRQLSLCAEAHECGKTDESGTSLDVCALAAASICCLKVLGSGDEMLLPSKKGEITSSLSSWH